MTEHGARVLQYLRDGQWRTVREIARGTHKCSRVTRATLVGALASGLTERRLDDSGAEQWRRALPMVAK